MPDQGLGAYAHIRTAEGVDINREIIASGAALACPRYDARYVQFEQAAALAQQPRSAYCVARVR